jgi:gas vesicle protein
VEGITVGYDFVYDQRLGIKLPRLLHTWENYHQKTQEQILMQWEEIRGRIPERIKDIEEEINRKQAELYEEENFERSCRLNWDISELASKINDLWLWYRLNQNISEHVD